MRFIEHLTYKISIFNWLLIFATFISCRNESDKRTKELNTIIDVNVNSETNDPISWPDFIEDIEIIKLESNSNSNIGSIDKVKIINSQIYVFDRTNQKVCIFDINGKYKYSILSGTRGPEGVFDLRDFDVDSLGRLHVLDFLSVSRFDNTGDFISKLNFSSLASENYSFNPTSFALANEDHYLMWTGATAFTKSVIEKGKVDDIYGFYRINSRGEIISKRFTLNYPTYHGNWFYPTHNEFGFLIRPIFDQNMVYKYKNNDVYPYLNINFGEYSIPEERKIENQDLDFVDYITHKQKIIEDPSFCHRINDLYEGDNFIYFTYVKDNTFRNTLYSKSTSSSISGVVRPSKKHLLPQFFKGIYKGQLIGIGDTYFYKTILDHYSYNNSGDEVQQKLLKVINSLEYSDNPFLMLISIKDF